MRVDQVSGCLLGGAVGDALGAAIEFDSLQEIRRRFGPGGARDYAPAYGRSGAITDDTQMTLFTAEGLIRANVRARAKGIGGGVYACLHHAYLRWLKTQGVNFPDPFAGGGDWDGWLIGVAELHSRRAPGNTCISALRTGKMGTIAQPLNDSKGCGGVMRVAPIALTRGDPFELGCAAAAITHGHPSGYLPAGFFAAVLSLILRGTSLRAAIDRTIDTLREYPHHEETLRAIEAAVRLADGAARMPEMVERLGGGWVGEEALGIALFCALNAESFEEGVLLAVNHSGDSDSTGSLTGNLLGALRGTDAILKQWLDGLELRSEIEVIAVDLHRHFVDGGARFDPENDWDKYPGW